MTRPLYHRRSRVRNRPSPARWQSGYAGDCKSPYIGSIPVRASTRLRQNTERMRRPTAHSSGRPLGLALAGPVTHPLRYSPPASVPPSEEPFPPSAPPIPPTAPPTAPPSPPELPPPDDPPFEDPPLVEPPLVDPLEEEPPEPVEPDEVPDEPGCAPPIAAPPFPGSATRTPGQAARQVGSVARGASRSGKARAGRRSNPAAWGVTMA
jgi:hypothetical protein